MDATTRIGRDLATLEAQIDYLTFACYRFNRNTAPHIEARQWRKAFVEADALEARYQAEREGEQLLSKT